MNDQRSDNVQKLNEKEKDQRPLRKRRIVGSTDLNFVFLDFWGDIFFGFLILENPALKPKLPKGGDNAD